MKKIVALVLSLVMVLGLATTAFAANTLSGTYTVKGTNQGATPGTAAISVTDAKAPKDVDKNGTIDATEVGNVKYFNIKGYSTNFVQVNSVADADMIVYYGNTESVFAYLKGADAVTYYGTGVAFNNFGKGCGQVDYDADADVKYYSFEDAVYEAVEAGAEKYLMVGTELVGVKSLNVAPNAHAPAFTYDKDYKVVAVKCAKCGVVANIVKNYASLPEDVVKANAFTPVNTGEYYYWTTATAGTAGDKVNSAETFDAGIAMYVGMSVMAAAGSAVVLKKKD